MKKLRVLILLFLITIIISSCNQTTQQGRYQMFKSRQITKNETDYRLFESSTVTYHEGDGEYVYIFDTQTGNITVLFRPTERKRIYKISDYKHE